MSAVIAPFEGYETRVRPEWIDDNGHMNMGYYVVVFDHATDLFLAHCGLDTAHRQSANITTFAAEAHVNYLREVGEGDTLRFRTWLLGYDTKRIHYIHEMIHAGEGYRAATNELLSLHVDRATRRVAPMADALQQRLAQLMEAHGRVPAPPETGRRVGEKWGQKAR
ncbi:MAG: thioesterase family protein [Pseudomonadota bacterium]|nr:thioesterase family protein [Pseudomonadota bacterium]